MMKLKKLFLIICTLCLALSLACGVAACGEGDDSSVKVVSIALNKGSMTLEVGQTSEKLVATVLPDDATDKTVTWSSSNEEIATVSDGAVTAKKEGKATIIATAGGKSAGCVVTVTEKKVEEVVRVTGITLNKTSLNLEINETFTLVATVAPENATNKEVTWATSDASIATVDGGLVTAKKAGTATIRATADEQLAECVVTVKDEEVVVVPVSGVTLNKTSLNLKINETSTLVATVAPENATNKEVTWTTSDASIATVDGGLVTAKKAGTATITATADGKSAECAVTVEDEEVVVVPVSGVTLNKSLLELVEEETFTLVATVAPADATNKEVTWTTSDANIATVVGGVVTAKKAGTATIRATADGKSAECAVTVTAKYIAVTKVELNRDSAALEVGATVQLTATVFPENATNKEISWSSSNEGVATVSNGTVTAHKVGTANITATTADGVSATCVITVSESVIAVTGITLNPTSAELDVGGTVTISSTVLPENATDKTVTWRSSNESVATVSGGVITAVGAGDATITATAGEKSAICTVKVKIPRVEVESITLNKTDLELEVDATFQLTYTINPSNATDNEVTWTSDNESVATVVDGLVTAKAVGTAKITASVGGKSVTCEVGVIAKSGGGDDPVDPPAKSIITYAHKGEESAAFEWKDTNASGAKVEYKLSANSSYIQIDRQLVRGISESTVRADILGLKGGEKYDFKITASDGTVEIVREVEISSFDRSGYAHSNKTDGVGAYKDDGTLKSGAVIIYLTEQNKNDIDGKGTSIAEYLAKADKVSTPIVIRVLGTVGSATWNEIKYTKSGSSLSASDVKGINGKQLPTSASDLTQEKLISGGFNTLNKKPAKFGGATCEPIDGLNSKATYDSSKEEYDSCWNDCTVSGGKDITVEGVGEDAQIFQWGFTFKNCNSIEVRNLRFYDYTEDACSFEGSENSETLSGFKHSNFWVHHNTFDIGMNYWDVCAEQDKKDGDGATDFKKLSYVTVAYNRYNNTHKTGLVGGGNTHYQACFTFHHNYYNNCDQRMPLGRQANMHIYNNYFYRSGLYSISLRARAYAYIENCKFTSGNGKDTTPIVLEQSEGDGGIPSAKVVDCEIEGTIDNNFSGTGNLYCGDRAGVKDVSGGNHYGLNFDNKMPYTVTDKLETSEVAGTIPRIAGIFKRDNNIKVAGGSQDDPPRVPDDVTMSIGNAVADGKLRISSSTSDKQDLTDVALTDNISFTAKQTTILETAKQFDDGKTFTHRAILGAISSSNQRYFKITLDSASTIKVYLLNAKAEDTAGRSIGLYTDTSASTLVTGTSATNILGGEAKIVAISVSAAGTYFLISTVGDLSIYAIDIAEYSGGGENPPAEGATQSVSYSYQDEGNTVSETFEDGELFTATLGQSTTVTKNYSTATADDSSGKTFDYGLLPGSGSGQTVTVVANKAITLTIYYTASDKEFPNKEQAKGGDLTWTIDNETTVSSKKTDNKSNKVAYSEKITLNEGQTVVISITASRLVLFGLFAVEN